MATLEQTAQQIAKLQRMIQPIVDAGDDATDVEKAMLKHYRRQLSQLKEQEIILAAAIRVDDIPF